MRVVSLNEGEGGITVRVSAPSRRYFDELVKLRCAPDLLAAEVFPNAKEITESFGAFDAVRKLLDRENDLALLGDPKVVMLDVGSGSTARTAATFACRTQWSCVAIDPVVNPIPPSGISRVSVQRKLIDACRFENPDGTTVAVFVHAHVDLREAIVRSIFAKRLIVVAMPCCNPLDLPEYVPPVLDYEDHAIWSPKRQVRVWDLAWDGRGGSPARFAYVARGRLHPQG